jgi:hypothetical protein
MPRQARTRFTDLRFPMAKGREEVVEQTEPITGRKALKEFLEVPLHQSAEKADALVQRLDEERSVETSDLALLDEDIVALGLK